MANPTDLKQQVLDRIHAGRLRVRSKLSLLVEQLGLDGIGLVMVLVAAVAVNLVLFWLRANDVFAWFAMGPLGVRLFFEAFPYLWLMSAGLACIAIVSIVHRLNLRAKPVPRWLLLTLLVAGIGLGSTAAFTNVNERIIETDTDNLPALRRVQRVYTFTSHHGRSGVVGNVVTISPDVLELDVRGQRVLVRPSPETSAALRTIVPGDRLLIVSPQANERPIRAMHVKKLRQIPHHQPPVQLNVRFIRPIERTPARGV